LTISTPPRRAIVVADGDVPAAEELPAGLLVAGDLLVVAADGGLRKAEQLGLLPDVVVGDGDSLAPEVLDGLAGRGIELQLHSPDKEQSDTELALSEAIRRGATQVVVLGALGGNRFEHALANLLLLAQPGLAGCDVRLVDGRTTIRVLADGGSLALTSVDGQMVSLLPLSEQVEGVRTGGLRFPLDGDVLIQGPTRGLSNEITGANASVAIDRGRLAVVQTRLADGDAPIDGDAS
jgi:thiamine pyrophosphokinase